MKIAGAPISWGVCKVPNWGYQMTPERVLTEMKQIGLTATEFGPQGWLPIEAEARATEVKKYGLKPVGAFFLSVMHDPDFDPIPMVNKELDAFEAAGVTISSSPRIPDAMDTTTALSSTRPAGKRYSPTWTRSAKSAPAATSPPVYTPIGERWSRTVTK